MKKKILSEAALQAMMATGDEPVVQPTAEELAELEAKKAEADKLEAEAAAKKAEKKDDCDCDCEEETAKAILELEASQAVNADLTAKLAEAEAKATQIEVGAEALKTIVAGQVSKMRIGLRFAAVDMSKFSIDALVTEYENTASAFMKALPVGSVVPEPKVENKEKAVNSSVEASAYKSLGF